MDKTASLLEETRNFAARHGLSKLEPAHVERMAELAVHVSDLGRTLPRPSRKADAPAPVFVVPRE